MAPNPEETFQSSLRIKYPKNRDDPSKNGDTWLKDKREDDGAEGLWRIHEGLYDFSPFTDNHPGGKEWLLLTKGTDITEAFEAHHLTSSAEKLLPKFHVRKSSTLRNYPFTYREDGFYKTLKRNVRGVLKSIPQRPLKISNWYVDFCLICTVMSAILAARWHSVLSALVSAYFLGCTVIAAHNYVHRKDNFRMFYLDLSFMSLREWKISHVLSHHLYTNTIMDLEISYLEPVFVYLPKAKSFWTRYGSWMYAFLVYPALFHAGAVRRYKKYILREDSFRKQELLPYVLPLVMHLFVIGFSSAHHHPKSFHDGDAPRSDLDWGLHQLDTVMDRTDVTGNHWLVLTNFGDHALHHMFPTLDHGVLNYLYPVFNKTMEEFNVKLRMRSQWQMFQSHFVQLARVVPNGEPPN